MKFRFLFIESYFFSFSRLLHISLFCLLAKCLCGQTCLPAGITFSTQQEIDDFATDYPGCINILGAVTIQEATANSITNLNGLFPIIAVDGFLRIQNNASIVNLNGLDSLTSIKGEFSLNNNDALINISALSNLDTIGSNLRIMNNDSLTSLLGFENLDSIGNDLLLINNQLLEDISQLSNITMLHGVLSISDNNLTTLNGLNNISTIGSALTISNSKISTLSALNNLISVGNQLSLSNNDNLTNVEGMNNLNTVGSQFTIADNDNLVSLEAFLNLEAIGLNLRILNNPALESLYGLDNIDPTTINFPGAIPDIIIINNIILSNCSVASICEALVLPETTTNIHTNATGCTNESEVETACSTLPVTWIDQPSVRQKGGHNEITWTVADQINNEKFVVEHRAENGSFRTIVELIREEITLDEEEYFFTHKNPPVGLNYYRIKQVDFDGNFSYSDITSISTNKTTSLFIFPNPSRDGLFSLETPKDVSFTLYSLDNQLLKSGRLNAGINLIDLSLLKPGIYILYTAIEEYKIIKV